MPPAARITSLHKCPIHGPGIVVKGEATVLIGGLPASRKGDACHCGAKIVMGSPTVFIGGKMAAREGDPHSHGGAVKKGFKTVLIGVPGKGECLQSVSKSGAAFVKLDVSAKIVGGK